MFVQPLDEQAIRMGSEITFLTQMVQQLQTQLKTVQEDLDSATARLNEFYKENRNAVTVESSEEHRNAQNGTERVVSDEVQTQRRDGW